MLEKKSSVETRLQPNAPGPGGQSLPAPQPGPLRVLQSWALDLFVAIIVSFFIILFVYQPVRVEGGSMEPGLEDQERIFINKLADRIESIERGDIVVFHYPRDTHKSFIKRVSGLPADHIRISARHVYANNQAQT